MQNETVTLPTGPEIRAARQARALTLKDLALKAEIGVTTLHGIETGKHAARASTTRKIMQALLQCPVIEIPKN